MPFSKIDFSNAALKVGNHSHHRDDHTWLSLCHFQGKNPMYVIFVLKTQMSLYTCSRIEYYSRAVVAKKIICFYYSSVSLKIF